MHLYASSKESGIQIVDITATSIQAVSYIRDPPAGTDFVSESVVQIGSYTYALASFHATSSLYIMHYNGITRNVSKRY